MTDKIRIKRVYEPAEPSDGARVLVDRVWPRGIRKEAAKLTLWLKDIAPSTPLRKWFGHKRERWEEFRQRYRRELDHNSEALGQLRDLSMEGRLTLLFSAHDSTHNNAVALAEYLQDHRRSG